MVAIKPQYVDVVPQLSGAVAGSLILSTVPCDLYEVTCVAGASAGFLMVFDAVAAPADGAVTPKRVFPVAASGEVTRTWGKPLQMVIGCVVVFSTTGPYTKTISNTAALGGAVQ